MPVQDEIIQVRLTDAGSQRKVVIGENTQINANTVIPVLVRKSAVQSFLDEGLLEQVPATTAIPLSAVFADIEVVGGKRVSVPIGPVKEQSSVITKKFSDGSNTHEVETLTTDLSYHPVTLVVGGVPTEYVLEFPKFSSATDSFPDVFSFATIRTTGHPSPIPLDTFDNYKDHIVLNPGQILNCRLNPRIVDLETKGLIQFTNISVSPANIPTPQVEVGPSPAGLPFPSIQPSPVFMWVDFFGFINSAPTFPIA